MAITPKDFAWIWQGIIKKSFTQGELHYLEPIRIHREKNNHAILLLHGFSSSPAVYRTLLPALEGYDAVVVPVLPGHAENIKAFSEAHSQAWIDVIQTECEQLLQRYEKVDVLGLSLGGVLAQHLAQTYKLHHLFLLAPAFSLYFPMNLGPHIPKILQKIGVTSIRNQGGNIHDSQYAELTYRKIPMQAIINILSFIHSFSFSPSSCPTDVFLGKHDAVVNSAKVMQLFQGQPHAHIHWLNHSAHVLPLDADRESICKVIKAHLHVSASTVSNDDLLSVQNSD
jgi:carboxylesterase